MTSDASQALAAAKLAAMIARAIRTITNDWTRSKDSTDRIEKAKTITARITRGQKSAPTGTKTGIRRAFGAEIHALADTIHNLDRILEAEPEQRRAAIAHSRKLFGKLLERMGGERRRKLGLSRSQIAACLDALDS